MTGARWRLPVLAASALLVLSGCAGESEATVPPTSDDAVPAGAVTLVETRPQQVGEARVVAFDVREEAASVGVSQGAGPAATAAVAVGDVVSIEGEDWQVVRIEAGEGGDGAPGSKTGQVVIAPPG